MLDSYLSLGSNMGNRKALVDEAVNLLGQHDQIDIDAMSAYYETAPWGGVEQEAFLNIALKIKTTLDPLALLDECQRIELLLHRERIIRWGPRTIDIDILSYGQERIKTERLEVPHPRMFERAFVLVPLLDIYEEASLYEIHIKDALEKIENQEIERL